MLGILSDSGQTFIFQCIYFSVIFEKEQNSLPLSHFFSKITRLLHHGTQPVEHQPIESVTVDNDAHFKAHDKTKQNQHVESQPLIKIVQCQMSIASVALPIQITSLLCFALGCSREKNLDNGFYLPPSQTNHTSIGSTHCSGWRIGNTAARHCRWQWSRSMLLHHPVCRCQFSQHNVMAGLQRILANLSQHIENTHAYSKHAMSAHLEVLRHANLCKPITRGQMHKHCKQTMHTPFPLT